MTKDKERVVDVTTHATIESILKAIRRNGLEKTLEDLRKACREGPPMDEKQYKAMLASCEKVSKAWEAIKKFKEGAH